MKQNKLTVAVAAVALATVASSCHIYQKFEMPKEGLAGEIAEAQKEAVDSTAYGNVAWDKMFTDPDLQALIQIALEKNVDLENARLNVELANTQLLGAKLSYLPSLALTPNGGTASYGGSKITKDSWSYTIPAAAQWEIDVFGKLLNNKRSAEVAILQSEAYRQAVRSQIIGGVANCYYTIQMLERQLKLLHETEVLWGKSIQTMKALKEAGRYNEVAVVQSQANYSSVKASIPQVELQLHQAYNSLSLLLNSMPKRWTINVDEDPHFPSYMEKGVPMKYLAARPDVKAAEQSLAAAYYTTNLARAAFYPSLAISVQGGFTNLLGSVIKNPGEWFWQLGGQLTAPLFSRGQNIANLKAAKLRQQQSLNSFEYTVMSASSEVSNALVTYTKNKQRIGDVKEQVKNLEKAVEYNGDLLTLGTATYLEVLTAQQSLLSAQMTELQCELAINQAAVSLYQALGGGR